MNRLVLMVFALLTTIASAQAQTYSTELESNAQVGDVDAQCVLGIYSYELGESKKTHQGKWKSLPEYKNATKWLKKASDKANPRAQYYLGLCYIMGKGTNENEFKGQELIYKSAISGYSRAQAFMANSCYWGMPRIDVSEEMTNKTDYENAFKWYYKAAIQGDNIALNEMLEYGYRNSLAAKWIEKVAKQGFLKAIRFMANYYEDKDMATSLKWTKMAAEKGDTISQKTILYLGIILYDQQYYYKCIDYLNVASRYNVDDISGYACLYLSKCYRYGRGVEQDTLKSKKFFDKACAKGVDDAKSVSDLMRELERQISNITSISN